MMIDGLTGLRSLAFAHLYTRLAQCLLYKSYTSYTL